MQIQVFDKHIVYAYAFLNVNCMKMPIRTLYTKSPVCVLMQILKFELLENADPHTSQGNDLSVCGNMQCFFFKVSMLKV